MRTVTVTADDFGLSPGVNRGVVLAHRFGIVTNASLMVRATHAPEAVAMAESVPNLALGLHLDLAEWSASSGRWLERYRRCDLDDPAAVQREVEAQVDRFVALVGRPPTHLDAHQHLHRDEPLASIAARWADCFGVPLRERDVHYCGGFYGQYGPAEPYPAAIAPTALARLIADLPDGVSEVACHPADTADAPGDYQAERVVELASLCDGAVAAMFGGPEVRLVAMGELVSRTDR